jgi:prepilin-type N-terminal cleavage/methylation domain-containing protein
MPGFARSRAPGFTLVELLVVVAILALLAGLVVPVLSMVFELANRSVCANNLRQIQLGMAGYEADHAGHPILHINFNGYSLNYFVFHGLVYSEGGHSRSLAPLGFFGLGYLVGDNGTRSEQIDGRRPRRHNKYVSDPGIFYCPSNTMGGKRPHTWTQMAYMKWEDSWSLWPSDKQQKLSTWISYSRRHHTATWYNPPIPDDHGFPLGPGRSNWIPEKQLTMLAGGSLFHGEAVASDTNASKLHVPACHGDGVNVVYRNGSVHYYQDRKGLLTTYNPVDLWGYSKQRDAKQVAIWNDYDKRFNP